MRQYNYHWLDVFTSERFGGNPLAVFPDAAGLTDAEMQNIARELNLSETTFVLPSEQPPAQYRVRIFTPINELPLAGHPVVGTHFLLASLGRYNLQPPITRIHQETGAGVLPVDLICPNGRIEQVRMTQAPPKFLARVPDLGELAAALGFLPSDLLDETAWPQVVSTGVPQLMVPVRDLGVLRKIAPNLPALRKLCDELNTEMVYVFALESFEKPGRTHGRFVSGHYNFEDPVTGSASGAMAAYLVYYGLITGNDDAPVEWIHEQGHFMQRPGRVYITVHGRKGNVHTVQVAGDAVIMGRGKFFWNDYMPWTEEQINALIQNVQRDFALERTKPEFWFKLKNRGISRRLAENVITKKSYIVEYDHLGPTIGFLDPGNHVFVAWKSDYPTELKTCFIADGGLDYLKRQYDFKLIWMPN